MCSRAFGINASVVDANIGFANSMYGGSNIQGSRILYPNGQIDPWSALGVLIPPNDESPVMMVTAASHHFWTHASKPTDDEFVVQARQDIWNQVMFRRRGNFALSSNQLNALSHFRSQSGFWRSNILKEADRHCNIVQGWVLYPLISGILVVASMRQCYAMMFQQLVFSFLGTKYTPQNIFAECRMLIVVVIIRVIVNIIQLLFNYYCYYYSLYKTRANAQQRKEQARRGASSRL